MYLVFIDPNRLLPRSELQTTLSGLEEASGHKNVGDTPLSLSNSHVTLQVRP